MSKTMANMIKGNDFYKKYFFMYLQADEATRQASIDHWTEKHAENILADRDDLIIFSAKMLAAATLAQKYARIKGI